MGLRLQQSQRGSSYVKLLYLRTKTEILIVLFSVCIIAFTWVTGYKYLEIERESMIADAKQNNAALAQIQVQHLHFIIHEIDDLLQIIVDQYGKSGTITPDVRRIAAKLAGRTDIGQVLLTDRDGNVIMKGKSSDIQNIATSESFLLPKSKAYDSLYIGKPNFDLVPGRTVIEFSRRLNDNRGRFAGTASVAVFSESLTEILPKQNQRLTEDSAIMGLDGIVRAGTLENHAKPGMDRREHSVFKALKRAPEGEINSKGFTGQMRYRYYLLMPDYPLVIVVGIDENEALKSYYERKIEYVSESSFLSLIVVGFCTFLIKTMRNRIAAEVRTKESKERYRMLVDDLQDVVVQTDLAGTILMTNRAMVKLVGGQSPQELIGKSISQFWQDEGKRTELLEIVKIRGSVNDFPVAAKDNLGNAYDFSVNVNGTFDPIGNMIGLTAVARNVTVQRRMEEEKQELHEKTATMDRISSLGTMVASVAHEVSQPLQAGKLAVESVLYWQEQGKEMSRDYQMDNIRRAADAFNRIGRIVRQLRDFAKPAGVRAEEAITLNQAVFAALDLMQARLQAHEISVHIDLQPDSSHAATVFSRLDEAIINVLNNALQALDTTSDIERQIWISARKEKDATVLEIENNGPPIDTSISDKYFEPFFTTKARTDGMGLGLHIVRSITQGVGGQVTIANSTRGVLVTFRFPMLDKGV